MRRDRRGRWRRSSSLARARLAGSWRRRSIAAASTWASSRAGIGSLAPAFRAVSTNASTAVRLVADRQVITSVCWRASLIGRVVKPAKKDSTSSITKMLSLMIMQAALSSVKVGLKV